MKRRHSWFIAMIVLGCLVAAGGSAVAQTASGKELYRNNCKVCHEKGSPQGQYTPMTLTQDQWRTFFKLKLLSSHKSVIHPKTGGKLLEQLTPDQIKAIQRFAIDHAVDSEQPATCG